MIVPSACTVNESCWIKLPDSVGESKLGVSCNHLTPSLVINHLILLVSEIRTVWIGSSYPCDNTRKALVLIDKNIKLAIKFRLLIGIGQNSLRGAIWKVVILQRSKSWHILNHKETHLVTSLVEQLSFNFDLQKK